MENKVIFEGVLLNVPKLTDFGSTLLRVKNTRSFKKKDGSAGETTYTAVVSVEWRKLAEEVVQRFKQNDLIRIEGELKKKNTKKVDQNGDEIYETWIKALSINALANMQSVIDPAIPRKPLEDRMGYSPHNPQPQGAPYIPKGLPNKAPYNKNQNTVGSSFDNQPLPIPVEDTNNVFEEVFGDELPF